MAFDSIVRLISGGTPYYLSGSTKTAYTGSGTPWTAEATTPYRLSLNDRTPIWVPQPAAQQVIYSGGPPFKNGRAPISRSRDNVTETVGVQMYASSADNAITLLRQLRLILNTANYTLPCVLAIQGGTNTVYYEVYHADVAEMADYLQEGNSTSLLLRATITWTRSYAGGLLSTGETLLSSSSFQNRFSGSPDNNAAFSTGVGEYIYEGSPLNVEILNTDATTLTDPNIYLASIQSVQSTASTLTITTSSSATTAGNTAISPGALANANRGTQMRVFAQTSAVNANGSMRLHFHFGNTSSSPRVYSSPWVTATNNTAIIDCGTVPATMFHGTPLLDYYVYLEVRSNTGGSVTYTLSNIYAVPYYTYCKLSGTSSIGGSSADEIWVRTFDETTDHVCLPIVRPVAYTGGSSTPEYQLTVAGTPPKYFSGALLLVVIQDSTSLQIDTTHTVSVSATHGALWNTLRGGN